jgi:hypothetical protein
MLRTPSVWRCAVSSLAFLAMTDPKSNRGDTMKAKTTSEVIEQFNRAFEQHDASLLTKSGDTAVAAAVRSAATS